MKKVLLSIGLLSISIGFLPIVTHAASQSMDVKVNGSALKIGEGQSFKQGKYIYVPLNAISKRMGDTVKWNKKKLTTVINKKKKTIITVEANTTTAIINNKKIALVSKKVEGKAVNAQAKAIYKKKILYVPLQFISNVETLHYKVKTTTAKEKTTIYIGKMTAQPTEPTQPSQPSTDKWVAPVLKSSWSPDHATNLKTLENELGFRNGGSRYSLPSYPGAIQVIDGSSYEVTLKFYGWTDPAIKYSERIPVVAKELFKLYFAGDANRVWSYFNSNDIPDKFTANGRSVTATYSPADGAVSLTVGRK